MYIRKRLGEIEYIYWWKYSIKLCEPTSHSFFGF